jgi:hypothetical protein
VIANPVRHKRRLVNPNKTPDRRPRWRSRHVGDRQQASWLRRHRHPVEDVAASGYTADRATVRQRKNGRPARLESSEQIRQAVDDYLKAGNKRPSEFQFTGRRGPQTSMTTRQCAPRSEWITNLQGDWLRRRERIPWRPAPGAGHEDPRRLATLPLGA